MATIKRSVNWDSPSGKKVEVKIDRIKDVQDKIAYADGDNINLGKETIDRTCIEVWIDGKFKTRSYAVPHAIDELLYKGSYKELKAKGIYARVGDAYITEALYQLIMTAITEMEAELTTNTAFETVKAKEAEEKELDRKEVDRYTAQIKNGLCPKCGTYCYGDCEAN